jgi:CheY-like chemotaxis protein
MGQASDISKTTQAGFDHHVTKPAQPDEILKLVA